MQTYDVIVVGAGGVGSATMATLARRGLRVLGIDRFAPPHDRGSSHGETRVIRQAYFEHPDYVPLLRRTYDLWRELEHRTGRLLMNQCGLLEVGPDNGEVVPGVRRAASDHHLPLETLTAEDVAQRWPALRVPEGLEAVFEPTAGYLHVEQCVETMLDEAKQLGAELVTDTQVTAWHMHGTSVEVETTGSTYSAGAAVVTAGAWAGGLLAKLGIQLTPLRKSLFWYGASGVDNATLLPVYLYELDFGVPYGFPSLDGQRIKIAMHDGGTLIDDPLQLDSAIVPGEQLATEKFMQGCLVGACGPPIAHSTCLYTMTSDGHFVVDLHPEYTTIAFAAGLSGHGFKFTPVLGEALADLVIRGSTSLPIDFLSAGRFL